MTVHGDTSTEIYGFILSTTTKNGQSTEKGNIPKIDQYWTFYLSVLIQGANIHKLATLSYF